MTKKNPNNKKVPKVASKKKSPSTKELNESLSLEKEKYVRLFAEFENYKRRTAKERIELFKTAGKDVLSSLVPVLEDFKRAISLEGSDSDDDGVLDGVDAFPKDKNETKDSDNDGVGDTLDVFAYNPNETLDTDGDGIPNYLDPEDTASRDDD